MKKANRRIVSIGHDLHPHLTFEHRVCVVQNSVDRMRGISIGADFVPSRGTRADLMPILRNWTASKALLFQRQCLPRREIRIGRPAFNAEQFVD
jgi:hypothetical protein